MKHNYSGIFFLIFLSLSSGLIKAQCNFTTSVPYYESFSGLSANNQLPTCWLASNPSVTCLTYTSSLSQNRVPRTGNEFASFFAVPTGTSSYYTIGIFLNAGSTYSASLWYTSEYYGYTNWTDLSILIGPSQAPAGQTVVASTGGPAVSMIYKSLSDTFSVATSGIYYASIRATNNSTTEAQYLSIDDLLIEQVCNVNISVAASTATLCQGQAITFTATGADTYTWSNGAMGPVITITPALSGTIGVAGTQIPSGCFSSTSINVPIYPAPNVQVFGNPTSICLGESTTLYAFGATSYTWGSTQVGTSTVVVSPTVTTTYTLNANNVYGCGHTQTVVVTVWPLPLVSVLSSNGTNTVCTGEQVVLTGAGASSFKWISTAGFIAASSLTLGPTATTTYTLEGTNAQGCKGSTEFVLIVSECTGLSETGEDQEELKVYPVPASETISVTLKNGTLKTLVITDVTGRVILSGGSEDTTMHLKLTGISGGIYYVTVTSNNRLYRATIVKE